ncbi:MAG: Spore photoproduct lyase, partial [uncultured Solirubrobacteraceae bacterium]
AVDAQASHGHAGRPGARPRPGDRRALRRPGHRGAGAPGQPADGAARAGRARDLPALQDDAGGGGRPAERDEAPAHPAERGLLLPPGPRLPRALPVLLPGRLAARPAGDAGLRERRRGPGGHARVRGPGDGDEPLPRARRRGDDVRGLLLHRPAGDRAPDGLARAVDRALRHPRRGRAALHHEVRRRVGPDGAAPRRPHAGALLGQRAVGGAEVRGRHGQRPGAAGGDARARAGGLSRRADDRADHALRGMARGLRGAAGPGGRGARRDRGRRPDGRAHHPPLHRGVQGGPQGLVSRDEARDGRGGSGAQAHEVRRAQVRLSAPGHEGARGVVRRRDPGPAARRADPLLHV